MGSFWDRVGKWTKWGGAGGLLVGGITVGTCILFPPAAPFVTALLGEKLIEAVVAGNVVSILGFFGSTFAGSGAVATASGIAKQYLDAHKRARVVQILGPHQAGKNSVFNTIINVRDKVTPTEKGTQSDSGKNGKAHLNQILNGTDYDLDFFQLMKDVSGEKDNWFIWEDLIRETNPHGIIYVIDSFTCSDKFLKEIKRTREARLKEEIEGLIFTIKACRKIQTSERRLKAFMILINKIDELDADKVINEIALEKSVVQQCKNVIISAKMNKSIIKTYLQSLLPKNGNILIRGFYGDRKGTTSYDQFNKQAMIAFKKELHYQ